VKMIEERVFWVFWSMLEYVKSDEGLIVGGVLLLVIVLAAVIVKEGIRLAHHYMRSL
jgi:hypothetical protein